MTIYSALMHYTAVRKRITEMVTTYNWILNNSDLYPIWNGVLIPPAGLSTFDQSNNRTNKQSAQIACKVNYELFKNYGCTPYISYIILLVLNNDTNNEQYTAERTYCNFYTTILAYNRHHNSNIVANLKKDKHEEVIQVTML